ncbi:MAG TPA: ABC transporter ATP-binding protein [Streptosporangiaceae bacterium]
MELRGVSKRYRVRGPWVLRDIDADLVPGQLIRVTGPNGCGKSTLLRLVSGAAAPSRGRIADRPRAGYVPERFPPGLPFTAQAYLTHLGRLHGLRGGALTAAVRGSIDRLGLGPYASLPMRELSKGTSQKVAVAQAMLGRPGLLVMDEAWTGLDAGARATLDTVVTERVAEGATVIFVDHDPARLSDQASQRWALIDGRLHVSSGGGSEIDGMPAEVQTIVIEFAGYRGGLAGLRGLGGVVTAEPGRVRVRVGESDDVLRWLLAAEGDVHVERVAAE